MKEIKKTVAEFITTHKEGIAITAGLAAAGVAIAYYWTGIAVTDLPKPKLHTGEVCDLWKRTKRNGETEIGATVSNLIVSDMGVFGEEMMRKVDDIGPDSVASLIIGFKQK